MLNHFFKIRININGPFLKKLFSLIALKLRLYCHKKQELKLKVVVLKNSDLEGFEKPSKFFEYVFFFKNS